MAGHGHGADHGGEGHKGVALLIAVLALFLALAETGAKSAQTEALAKNVEAANLWAFFQARSIRQTTVRTAAEQAALQYLQQAQLRLLVRNYRTPGRGGGEIDLIMQASDGTVVFVEVRKRSRTDHGGGMAGRGAAQSECAALGSRGHRPPALVPQGGTPLYRPVRPAR